MPLKFILALLVALLPATVCHPATHIETVVPTESLDDLGEYVITAYCSCEICCGEWAKNRPNGKVIVNGIELTKGSCASPLPQGTVVLIEGLGEYTVHDRTAEWIVDRYQGKIIDLYFESHEEASRFGKHQRNVQIVSRGK